MKTLLEVIQQAEKQKKAVGHFNVAELTVFHAVLNAVQKLKVPVIIGLSESERRFFDERYALLLVRHAREVEKLPVYINADHTRDVVVAKRAIDLGYDSVIFDGTDKNMWNNIALTKQIVQYARKRGGKTLIEGELGYIGSSSKLLKKIPVGVLLADQAVSSADALQFVRETGVDMLAPAIGNVHGIVVTKKHDPRLNHERIKEIKKAVGVPLVLHGASGNSDRDIRESIKAGIGVVHISSEIRLAWRRALDVFLASDADEIAPYRLLNKSQKAAEKVIEKYLRLFNRL